MNQLQSHENWLLHHPLSCSPRKAKGKEKKYPYHFVYCAYQKCRKLTFALLIVLFQSLLTFQLIFSVLSFQCLLALKLKHLRIKSIYHIIFLEVVVFKRITCTHQLQSMWTAYRQSWKFPRVLTHRLGEAGSGREVFVWAQGDVALEQTLLLQVRHCIYISSYVCRLCAHVS